MATSADGGDGVRRGEVAWVRPQGARGTADRPVIALSRDELRAAAGAATVAFCSHSRVPMSLPLPRFPQATNAELRQGGRGFAKPFDLLTAESRAIVDPQGFAEDERFVREFVARVRRTLCLEPFDERDVPSAMRLRASQDKAPRWRDLARRGLVDLALGTRRFAAAVVSARAFHESHPYPTAVVVPILALAPGEAPLDPRLAVDLGAPHGAGELRPDCLFTVSLEDGEPRDRPARGAQTRPARTPAGPAAVTVTFLPRRLDDAAGAALDARLQRLFPREVSMSDEGPWNGPKACELATRARPLHAALGEVFVAARASIDALDAAHAMEAEGAAAPGTFAWFGEICDRLQAACTAYGSLFAEASLVGTRDASFRAPGQVRRAATGDGRATLFLDARADDRLHLRLRNDGAAPVWLAFLEWTPRGELELSPAERLGDALELPPGASEDLTLEGWSEGMTTLLVVALAARPEGDPWAALVAAEDAGALRPAATVLLGLKAVP